MRIETVHMIHPDGLVEAKDVEVYGLFAVTPVIDPDTLLINDSLWAVTHVPTGMSVGWRAHTQREIPTDLAKRMAEVCHGPKWESTDHNALSRADRQVGSDTINAWVEDWEL